MYGVETFVIHLSKEEHFFISPIYILKMEIHPTISVKKCIINE